MRKTKKKRLNEKKSEAFLGGKLLLFFGKKCQKTGRNSLKLEKTFGLMGSICFSISIFEISYVVNTIISSSMTFFL